MRVLVTGGTGFIGKPLVRRLASEGAHVTVLSRSPERFPSEGHPVEYLQVDVAHPAEYRAILGRVDRIYHLAWTTIPATSEKDWARDVQDNVLAGCILFGAAAASSARELVFVSSGGTVYGRPHSLPIPEDHPTAPVSAHGVAKLCVERYGFLLSQQGSIKVTVLRAGNVYGETQDPAKGLGFVSAVMASLRRRTPLEVWGDGSIVRDYLHIEDMVEGLLALPGRSSGFDVFNVGTGVGTSQMDVLRMAERASGRRVIIQFRPGRMFDVPENILDNRKALEAGWQPRLSLAEGIERMWKQSGRGAEEPSVRESGLR